MEYSPNKMKRWLLFALGSAVFFILVVMVVKNRYGGWKEIGATPSLTYYADSSSVQQSDKNATIWLLADNKAAQLEDGKSYISSKQQYEIDCNGAKKRLVRFTLYAGKMGTGSEVATSNLPNQEWSPAPPGTVAWAMWELSCKQPWWKFWH